MAGGETRSSCPILETGGHQKSANTQIIMAIAPRMDYAQKSWPGAQRVCQEGAIDFVARGLSIRGSLASLKPSFRASCSSMKHFTPCLIKLPPLNLHAFLIIFECSVHLFYALMYKIFYIFALLLLLCISEPLRTQTVLPKIQILKTIKTLILAD